MQDSTITSIAQAIQELTNTVAARNERIAMLESLIRKTATGMIQDAIQAVEFDDMDDPQSWVNSVDHWQSEASTGIDLLTQIGDIADGNWQKKAREIRTELIDSCGDDRRVADDCEDCDGEGFVGHEFDDGRSECETCDRSGKIYRTVL